ncbi:interleukin 15%2C like [Xyrichtys novacula]|uniref:Interleukin n=1 Tax=Xyrichtys novacula TaxID=13765 RepID=A0AAV1G100_XYRNO|nr:interleukin 15%2C like [Xyrichtys novacula]
MRKPRQFLETGSQISSGSKVQTVLFLGLQRHEKKSGAQNFRGIQQKVRYFINNAPMELLDCRLYTPTINDYQNCPQTTMKCFADEVKVLIEEWETVKDAHVIRLDKMLKQLATKLPQTASECRQCELLQEEKAEKFLEYLERTLQMGSIKS